jgi:pimeloyl-ACP methyl ester carboxylesterase
MASQRHVYCSLKRQMKHPAELSDPGPATTCAPSDLRHSFISVEGTRLHWAELGDASDLAPVVLLHGLNDSHLTWKCVARALAVDRRVLMPDLPGYGLSERSDASYELAWHAHMIVTWLESVGLDSVDVVGHSFGGGVAQMMLLERPTCIRRLVLVASGGLGREVSLALRLASLPGVVELLGQRFMGFGTRVALRHFRGGFSEDEVEELCAINSTRGSARAFARTVRDVIDWRGQRRTFFQRAEELGALPPIAIFWGDRDEVIPIAHGTTFSERVEGVVLTPFPGCGHYLHSEQPDMFVRTVREFLNDPTLLAARLRAAKILPLVREPVLGARFPACSWPSPHWFAKQA